jgi:hypothetical protein
LGKVAVHKGNHCIALGDSQGTQALFYFPSFLFELFAIQNAPKCRLLNKSEKALAILMRTVPGGVQETEGP